MKMKQNRSRRKLAALAATVTATGGLLMIAPAAHADGWPMNRCDVAAVYCGASWVYHADANWVDHWAFARSPGPRSLA
ncbi:hypothetical protein ACIBHX_25515 [Nonomuraea sp. NPDC050536]|uniref:hypothetical protein n=1 Tax=Nonomuraea sp. NPDC050536 TaxID=3364366 RepID=UPI0037C978C1